MIHIKKKKNLREKTEQKSRITVIEKKLVVISGERGGEVLGVGH